MALTAKETLIDIIDVSKTLLQRLDTPILESKQSIPEQLNQDSQNQVATKELLSLMAKREENIHQLFEYFSHDELQMHLQQLQTMALLDRQLIEKVNCVQKSAKSTILTLKKNKKAISLYQKL
ncbi:MAG: hypothetical protein ACJASU_000409 [Cognaticolwellia sp.]